MDFAPSGTGSASNIASRFSASGDEVKCMVYFEQLYAVGAALI